MRSSQPSAVQPSQVPQSTTQEPAPASTATSQSEKKSARGKHVAVDQHIGQDKDQATSITKQENNETITNEAAPNPISSDTQNEPSSLSKTMSGNNIKYCVSDGDLQSTLNESNPTRRESCHILIQVHDSTDELPIDATNNVAASKSSLADVTHECN